MFEMSSVNSTMRSNWTEIAFLCDKVNIGRLCLNIRFQKTSEYNNIHLLLLLLFSRTRKLVISTMPFIAFFNMFRIYMDLLRQLWWNRQGLRTPRGGGVPKRTEC